MPDGGMFGPISDITQHERRACQAFLKMLVRHEKRTDDGFVRWVDERAKLECGELYHLVETQIKKRLAKNKAIRESQEKNNDRTNS